MMAQFSKEVSDDDGDGNQTGDGRGAEEGVGQDGEAMADLVRGLLKLLGLEPTAEMGQTSFGLSDSN